jgi:hypothetical protein
VSVIAGKPGALEDAAVWRARGQMILQGRRNESRLQRSVAGRDGEAGVVPEILVD